MKISATTAALNGMRSATAQFDRAAQTVTTAATALDSTRPTGDATDIVSGMTDMMTARLAFSASLQVARASHDMLAEAINLGGYGTSVDRSR